MILYRIGRTIVMLIGGAAAGFVYVLVLPFLWTGAAVFIIADRSFEALMRVAAKSTSFGWRPVQSYLTGRDKKKKKSERDEGSKEA